MHSFKRFLAATSALLVFSNTSWAQISIGNLSQGTAPASEFFVGKELGKPLITVNLISGVNRPGVYHVPQGTDLASLLAYAGGSMEKADLTEVSIRRNEAGKPSQESVNFQKLMKSQKPYPQVSNLDVVYIPPRQTMENTLTWVTLISSIASIALSAALIHDIDNR